ncbi:hypothetical protein L3Q82_002455 [Scortum barcoo]|uniref:Uncharacterized protein n=1 Tax=Scortum barcoo TaxID=214431 RepID=A0ACB8W1C0_9TELE|nr:hypothetical protein L3Q82_002455 [Scortum barcoo]
MSLWPEFWSRDWVAESPCHDCYPNHIAPAPHGPFLRVVSLLEGGPTGPGHQALTCDPQPRPGSRVGPLKSSSSGRRDRMFHQIRMFVVIWATLFFSVRGNNADTAEHHDTKITCKVIFTGNRTTEETVTLNVTCQSEELLTIISRPEVIVSFFIGVLLSAVLYCLAAKCHRNKQKIAGNVDETLEMTTSREDPLIDGPKDLKYATIDFSVLKRKCPSEAAKKQESTETEYAEVKIQVKEEREDPGEEEGEVLEEEEEAMIVEDEETKHCVPEEEEGKDEAVYSNVKDIMGLIQKPTVLIPPLTEGQQTTLTCTAPGLCSGSDPNITWTWRGAGEKDSHITGNITAFKTETVTQRHSSTLTFNPSAEHHDTKVTCKVIFTGNRTTEETVTLNVTCE